MLKLDRLAQELPLALENSDSGTFGSCREHAKQNAANIEKLSEFTDFLAEDVSKVRNEVNEKYFMVLTKIAAVKTVQKDMLEIQNRNWKLIEGPFKNFEHNMHVLRDCDPLDNK